jgi:hypothetical protein
MQTRLVTCPQCGLQAEKTTERHTEATTTTTVRPPPRADMKRQCENLEYRDNGMRPFCAVLQEAIDSA